MIAQFTTYKTEPFLSIKVGDIVEVGFFDNTNKYKVNKIIQSDNDITFFLEPVKQ